jgi:hypothetical protein
LLTGTGRRIRMKALKKNFPYWIAVLVAVTAVLIASQGGLSTPWYGGGWQGPESGGGTGHCTNCDVALFADSSAVSHYADTSGFAVGSVVALRESIGAVLADSCILCSGGALRDSIGDVIDDSIWAFFRDSVGAVIWDSVWESSTLRDSVAIILSDSCTYCDPLVFRDSVGAIIRDSTTFSFTIPANQTLTYLDTIISGGARLLYYVDLRDPRFSSDLTALRQMEERTSWYKVDTTGVPTRFVIRENAAKDTLFITNVDKDRKSVV